MFGLDKVKRYWKEKESKEEDHSFQGSEEELEEGDMTALLVSAAMVFLPVIGVLGLMVIFLV